MSFVALHDALERAYGHTVDWAARDVAGRAAVQLSIYALARLHYAEEYIGATASARCIVGPDSSPSKNPARLASGFTTGGEVWWSPNTDIAPLDMFPNCCGIAVARVDASEPLANYFNRLTTLSASPPTLDGVRIQVDLNRKNHFLGLFRDDEGQAYALVHCSAPEFKATSPFELGLSWKESDALSKMMHVLETPAGPIRFLSGRESCSIFAELTDAASAFARSKRQLILEAVFGPTTEVMSDRQHQGYVSRSHVVLGSQMPDDRSDEYIYLLGPRDDARLVTKAQRLPLSLSSLEKPAVVAAMPHGGGYVIPGFDEISITHEAGTGFAYRLRGAHGIAFMAHGLDGMESVYRGHENLEHARQLGIVADVVGRLMPIATLRN